MDGSPTDLPQQAVGRIAADHGLDLDTSTITVNEMGLDFRVAIARTSDGDAWVLRPPGDLTCSTVRGWRVACCD